MSKASDRGTIFHFTHHRKAEVEELLITDGRLEEVQDALRQFLKLVPNREQHWESEQPDSLYPRSLYCFAAITYARCFASGRRKKLEIDDIVSLTQKDRELHESVRRLRNQYFAHAVADEEGAHVLLYAKPGEKDPSGFTVMQVVLMGDSNSTARRFLSLVGKIRKHVQLRIADAGDEIAKAHFGASATWQKYAPKGRRGA